MILRCNALDLGMLKSLPMRFLSLFAPAHFFKRNYLPCFHAGKHGGKSAMSSKSAIAISGAAAAFLAAQNFVTPVAPTAPATPQVYGALRGAAGNSKATTPLAIKATAATAALLAVAGLAKGALSL